MKVAESTKGVSKRTLCAYGETKSFGKWLKDPRCEVSNCVTLGRRIDAGLTPEQAIKRLPLLPLRIVFEGFGVTQGLDDWAKDARCIVSRSTLYERVEKGIPLIEAMTQPAGKVARQGRGARRKFTAFGETKTLMEWAADPRCEVGFRRLEQKVRLGIPLQEALRRLPVLWSGILVSAFGEAKSAAEWARDPRCAVSYGLLGNRLRLNEPAEQAITRPTDSRQWEITAFGTTKTLIEWASDTRCRVTHTQLLRRLLSGTSPEVAIESPRESSASKEPEPTSMRLKLKIPALLRAFGESKTLLEWTNDDRCTLSIIELKDLLKEGGSLEEAIQERSNRLRH